MPTDAEDQHRQEGIRAVAHVMITRRSTLDTSGMGQSVRRGTRKKIQTFKNKKETTKEKETEDWELRQGRRNLSGLGQEKGDL